MKKLEKMRIDELAALISEKLRTKDIFVTLTGGACAQIYSDEKYVTGDLDFVVSNDFKETTEKIEPLMAELGFQKAGRIFQHKELPYTVEFPPGPLGIGFEYRIKPIEKNLSTGRLKLLSPTDSVKDRLAGFFYANDEQCLEQAIMVCQMNPVDLDEVRKWAEAEGSLEKYRGFEKELRKQPRR